MSQLTSGGFTARSAKTERLIRAIEATLLTSDRYLRIPTGIEDRFGDQAPGVHQLLYNSTGPTTDLLRYFPDALFLDRLHLWPTWEKTLKEPITMAEPGDEGSTGLFSFYVEYKFSDSMRRRGLGGVPAEFVGIIEREAWLTYMRMSKRNPEYGIYLDGQRARIALFFAATYTPDVLYGCWEHELEPIDHSAAIRKEVSEPNVRAVDSSSGSGTPWINFDIRRMKPLETFANEDLYWPADEAVEAVRVCKEIVSLKQP